MDYPNTYNLEYVFPYDDHVKPCLLCVNTAFDGLNGSVSVRFAAESYHTIYN